MSTQTNTLNFRNVTWWAVIVLALVLLYQVIAPYMQPLGWGVILAIFFYPVHSRVRNWVGNRNLAATITLFLVLVTLVGPTVWLSITLVREVNSAVQDLPEGFLQTASRKVEKLSAELGVPIVDVELQVKEAIRDGAAFLASKATNILSVVIHSFLHLLIFLLALFYLLRDGPRILQVIKDVAPVGEETRDRMLGQAADMIQATILSSVVVSVAQGLLGGITFWLLGLPSPLIWGLVIGVLAFLPVIGPSLVWAPIGTYLMFNGEPGRGLLLIVLGFVFVSSSDKVMRPLLIAGRARLNELLVLVSLLGGLEAFGFIGIILGPVIVATCVGMLKGYREALVDAQDTVAVLPLGALTKASETASVR
ncbi:MAG: AI-2E family transporter [Bryobacterales bacterium]|jgi:predicted PurR-regulated permease PerM|nr:AI-2E family transporter [Bryobacterales bacterium]